MLAVTNASRAFPCRRYEAESAVRLGLQYEPSAAVKSAVEICDEIAELLCGRGYEDDIHDILGECNHEEPFEYLERALRLATRPFPDLKARIHYQIMFSTQPARFNSNLQRRRQEEDEHLALKEIRAEQVSLQAGAWCSQFLLHDAKVCFMILFITSVWWSVFVMYVYVCVCL